MRFDFGIWALALMPTVALAVASPDFARDVRPVFERSCYGCHGPEKQKNGYRLDVRDIAIKGGDSGEAAVVPHDAKRSPLIRYVSGEDEEMLMPPKQSDKPRLTAAEVETLLGDPTKAREKLGWTPTTTLEELVAEMVATDKEEARKEALLRLKGFNVVGSMENPPTNPSAASGNKG